LITRFTYATLIEIENEFGAWMMNMTSNAFNLGPKKLAAVAVWYLPVEHFHLEMFF
jgi:hypothetical protein